MMAQDAEEQKLFDAAAAWLSYASRVTETACADAGPQVLPTPEEVIAVSAVPCQANALADFALHQLQADIEQRRMPPFWAKVAECAHTLRSNSEEDEGSLSESHAVDKVGLLLHCALKDLHSVVSNHCIQLSQLSQQLLSQQQDTHTTPHITLYPPTSTSHLPTQPSNSWAATSAPQNPTPFHPAASPRPSQGRAFVFDGPTHLQPDTASHLQGVESGFSFPSLPPPSMVGQQQQQQQPQQYGCPSTPPPTTKHALSHIPEPATPQLLPGTNEAQRGQQHPFKQQQDQLGGVEGHGQRQLQQEQHQQHQHWQQQQQQQQQRQQQQEHHAQGQEPACRQSDDQQEHQHWQLQQQHQQQHREAHRMQAQEHARQQSGDQQHHQHQQQRLHQHQQRHPAQAHEPPQQQSDEQQPHRPRHPSSPSVDTPASVGMCALAQLPKVFEVRVSALLLASATCSLAGVLLQYFRARLLQLGHQMAEMEGHQGHDMQGSTAGTDGGHRDAQHTPPPTTRMTDASTPSPAAAAAHSAGGSQAAGQPWSGDKPTNRHPLRVSVGNGGNDAMECDDATATETPAAAAAATPTTAAAASMDFDVGSMGAERRQPEHKGSGRRRGGMEGRDGGDVSPITPDTPHTPAAAVVSCLLGRRWEGEVADVASLMAGLGAHAACEEAAAAAVAADVHRRLSELAKG
ncbi:hypothetical protein DUNSADRAFT_10706 [Dunaliella salina]|uniref:Uncharacterized protein n=1 Tax=Dunaliella salina TaxID=3046 RepID=A0ABQ7GEQ2_DUNSA|nr:hypothetical protein DUNSADRAFT_10706 [Dunaliella salina]|eukprot:KAF5833087.1 hypothetical protein DUNSADRAFT_10706 [Dunaliella salina]